VPPTVSPNVQRSSKPQPGIPADFYAPGFEIEVEGQKLDPVGLGDLFEVKVEMAIGAPTHFELVLDYWDDRLADFKNKTLELAGVQPKPLFDLGHRVFVKMGYAGRLLPMVRGQVTTLSAQFPASGARALTVSGLDSLFRMMHGQQTVRYVNKADWEIAQELASRQEVRLQTRVTPEGPKHTKVTQLGEDAAKFLLGRAQRNAFDFYLRMDPATGKETMVFAKSESRDTSKAPVYVFEWGKSLISFSPVLDISSQVSEVEVRGSNPDDKEHPFVGRAGAADLPTGGGRNGPAVVKQVLGEKRDLVQHASVSSAEDAQRVAVSRLRALAYDYSQGSGEAIGLPELRPGDNVDIKGVGPHFGGIYQVHRVGHTIDSSGYRTTFGVRRPHDGGTGS